MTILEDKHWKDLALDCPLYCSSCSKKMNLIKPWWQLISTNPLLQRDTHIDSAKRGIIKQLLISCKD